MRFCLFCLFAADLFPIWAFPTQTHSATRLKLNQILVHALLLKRLNPNNSLQIFSALNALHSGSSRSNAKLCNLIVNHCIRHEQWNKSTKFNSKTILGGWLMRTQEYLHAKNKKTSFSKIQIICDFCWSKSKDLSKCMALERLYHQQRDNCERDWMLELVTPIN